MPDRSGQLRALITGGRGFVGGWLREHLEAEGDEVVAIDQEVEITDPAALRPVVAEAAPEMVYHLAARTHVGDSWDAPSEVLSVNVIGTAEVLAAARALPNDPRVLVVSSAEVYGVVAPGDLPLTEASPVQPATPYAASKAAAEEVARQAWRGYGQPVVVVRPFNHIGPRQSPNFAVPALARRIVEAQAEGLASLAVGTLNPAGLHRRAGRRAGLPPAGPTGRARRHLQHLFGPGRGHLGGGRPAAGAGRCRP